MKLNISELKDLILWAKKEKVRSLSIDGASFELSDLALVEGLTDLSGADQRTSDISIPASSPRLPDGNTEANEDD